MSEISEDAFLGGQLRVRQFIRGFRSGLDAAMLAAAVPAKAGDTILELGSGAGAASLCLAARVPDCSITGIEIDPNLVSLANGNAAANGMADRVRFVAADALALPPDLRRQFDHVLCNPPFHENFGGISPDAGRARALHDTGDLARWLQTGVKRTSPNGAFTVVLRADRLGEALAAAPARGITVFPLWPKVQLAAKRVLIHVRPGSRAPLILLPGLVLHQPDGRYTPEAEAILHDGMALSINSAGRPKP